MLLDQADAGMAAYARRQKTQADALGIDLMLEAYPATAAATLDRLAALAQDPAIDAVATLHPLPDGLDPVQAATTLGAARDIDGQHPLNAGLVALGAPAGRPPPPWPAG